MPGARTAQYETMKNTHDYLYLELLKRSVAAFQSALKGPDPEGEHIDAPMLDQYLIVLDGQKMNLHGWVDGHPKHGTSLIQTSLLVHVTQDRRWARTLSRWYQLGDLSAATATQISPDIDPAVVCSPMGTGGISIPFTLAQRVMEQQPTRFAEIAVEKSFEDLSSTLSEIAKNWPPSA